MKMFLKNHLRFFLILPMFFVLGISFVNAQSKHRISGVVMDADTQEPLTGAYISLPNQKVGISTDKSGEFILTSTKPNPKLLVSFIGYKNKEVTINYNLHKRIKILLIPNSKNLEEVIVSAKSKARKLREEALPVSIISIDEIKGTVGDLQGLLTKTMGIKIRRSGAAGSASRISLRGLEGKRIGYFIDEHPMNDNTDFVDLNDIPIDMIERVEVYKGIVPAKLGGTAIGGAVNIVLKEYPPKYFDLSYHYGSFNTHKTNVVTKFNNKKSGLEFGVGGFYTYSDNNYEMELPLNKGVFIKRDHDMFEKKAIGGSIKARKWFFDEITIEPTFMKSKKEIQGIEYNIQEAMTYTEALLVASHWEKNDFIWKGLDFDLKLGYAYTVFKFQDKAMHTYLMDGTQEPPKTKWGGEIGYDANDALNKKYTSINKLNLNYVLNDWSNLNLNVTHQYTRGVPQDSLKKKSLEGKETNFKSKMNSMVVGLSYELRLLDNKFMNSTVAKYYHYKMKTKKVDHVVPDQNLDIDISKSDFGISNASRYFFSKNVLAKASFSYDVRLPSDDELLGDGFHVLPASNLEPERNTSINIGLMYDKAKGSYNRLQLELNAFYMYLEKMIRFSGGFLQEKYSNFGEARTIGVEAEVKWDATKFLYLYANATYQDQRDTRKYVEGSTTLENQHKGERMPDTPYFYANAGIEVHERNVLGGRGQNSRFFISASFVEEYYPYFKESDNPNQLKYDRTLTFDSGIEHSFLNEKIIIGLQVNNLTNQKIFSELYRPLPARNWAVKLRYIVK